MEEITFLLGEQHLSWPQSSCFRLLVKRQWEIKFYIQNILKCKKKKKGQSLMRRMEGEQMNVEYLQGNRIRATPATQFNLIIKNCTYFVNTWGPTIRFSDAIILSLSYSISLLLSVSESFLRWPLAGLSSILRK